MNANEPIAEETLTKAQVNNSERAIEILDEALSGQSGKSKNSLIKEAIKALEG